MASRVSLHLAAAGVVATGKSWWNSTSRSPLRIGSLGPPTSDHAPRLDIITASRRTQNHARPTSPTQRTTLCARRHYPIDPPVLKPPQSSSASPSAVVHYRPIQPPRVGSSGRPPAPPDAVPQAEKGGHRRQQIRRYVATPPLACACSPRRRTDPARIGGDPASQG